MGTLTPTPISICGAEATRGPEDGVGRGIWAWTSWEAGKREEWERWEMDWAAPGQYLRPG